MSTKKLHTDTSGELRLEIGSKISELRVRLGMTQEQMAKLLGRKRVALARWELGHSMPPPRVMADISKLAAAEDKDYWREKAGLPKQEEDGMHTMEQEGKVVPLYKGKIAAGHGTQIEGEIQEEWTLPKTWFQPGSKIIALKVEGDSMADLVNDGYMVLIDVSTSDVKRLVGHMVAARSPHGCTVKWLRKSEDTGFFQLIPHHVSEDYPIRTITPENQHEFGLIGRVVHWIGTPKPPKPKRQR